MTHDDVSTLPAWPKPLPVGSVPAYHEFMWPGEMANAYRARMEALVEVVREIRKQNSYILTQGYLRERIDALLAACEREK